MNDIVLLTIFLVDIQQNVSKLGPIFQKHFGGTHNYPLSASIGTDALYPADPPLLVEMTCQAIVPS